MDKALNEIATRQFAEALEAEAGWARAKAKEPLLGGAPVFERRIDRERAVWVVFGGFKDKASLFGLFGGWATSALRYGQLEVVDEPPGAAGWPASGLVDLRDLELIHGQRGAGFVALELPPPPDALRREVLGAYVASPAYALWLDKAVAFEARRKQPPTREQIDAETRRAEAAFMAQWSHVIERQPSSVDAAATAIATVVDQALAHLRGHGWPFLQARVGAAG